MSSLSRPIKIWGKEGPNPPKVLIILEELGLEHEIVNIELKDSKSPEYVAINPNGRLPAIHDPNTDITLWESGAIIEYLISRYDTAHKLSFPPGTAEAAHVTQWLFYQVTGQGPYYGQAVWFKKFHHEDLPSAKARYYAEINRVTAVLEGQLVREKEKYGDGGGGPWLVGNKLTYADLSFLTWQASVPFILGKNEYDVENYPEVKAWTEKMKVRESAKKVLGSKYSESA